jgi:hypothetical protein
MHKKYKDLQDLLTPYVGENVYVNGERGALIHRDGIFYKLSIRNMLTPDIRFNLDDINGSGLFKYRLSGDPELCIRTVNMKTCRWNGDAWNSGTTWAQALLDQQLKG